jgi:putative transposase
MRSHEDEQAVRRAWAQDIALFRYRLIAPALDAQLSTKQRGGIVRGIAERVHVGAKGRVVQVSRKSLDRWIRAWRAGGFEALVPQTRRPEPRTDADVLALAAALKRENPQRTAAQVRRLLIAQREWAPSERTLQRLFVREELSTPRTGPVFGRFEAETPNLLWTGDFLHGPRVDTRKAFLAAFIDDHSRALMAYRWGWAEDSVHLAAALKPGLAANGIPSKVYVDNGASFIDAWLARCCAKLGAVLTHSPPYRPQGRGKVERLFETVRGQFLVEISPDGRPAPGRRVPASLEELNGWFTNWVQYEYHVRIHTETGQAPRERWAATAAPRYLTGPQLDEAFKWEERRVVAASTRTVKLHGNVYQVHPHLAGRQVTLVFEPFDLTDIEVRYRDKSYGRAEPFTIKRHSHPKVNLVPHDDPVPDVPPTGVDYMALLEQRRLRIDGAANSISFTDLAATDADGAGSGGETGASC